MRKWISTLLVAVTATTTVSAFDWNCATECSYFEVFGAPLYYRPSVCDLGYAILDQRDFVFQDTVVFPGPLPQGQQFAVNPHPDWGFRVGAGYVFDCKDVRLTYQRLETKDTSSLFPDPGNALWITSAQPFDTSLPLVNALAIEGGIEAFAISKVCLQWDAVDGEFGSRQVKGCNLWMRNHIGLHWTELKFNRTTTYQGSSSESGGNVVESHRIHDSSCTWGIGPRVGSDMRYDIACGLGLGGHCGLALLVGEAKSSSKQADEEVAFFTFTEDLDVCHRSNCALFPEVDASLGVNYLMCCSCFDLFFELGYEFRSYINALTRTVFNDAGATNAQYCDSFNLNGFYFDLKATF